MHENSQLYRNKQKERKKIAHSVKIPSRLERIIETYIKEKTGKPVDDPSIRERIKQTILAQKAGYWNKTPHAKYGKGYDVFAYLAYQAPSYIIQFHYLIKKLDKDGVLPEKLNILDIGTGPGTIPLAVLWHMKEQKRKDVSIDVIEKSDEFIEAFKYIVPTFASDISLNLNQIIHDDLSSFVPKTLASYTMITCQNVFAELVNYSPLDKMNLLMQYVQFLSDDGLLILVEPAELRHSTELRVLQKELENAGLFLYGPCVHIQKGICQPEKCWSFVELPRFKPTRLMKLLSGENESFRFMNTDIKFSYSILTKKPRNSLPSKIPLHNTISLRNLNNHLGSHVTVVATKMSQDIGNHEFAVYYVCDGSGGTKVYLVIPRSLKSKGVLVAQTSEYGEILKISNVRVRWNSREKTFNLVAGLRTTISAIHK